MSYACKMAQSPTVHKRRPTLGTHSCLPARGRVRQTAPHEVPIDEYGFGPLPARMFMRRYLLIKTTENAPSRSMQRITGNHRFILLSSWFMLVCCGAAPTRAPTPADDTVTPSRVAAGVLPGTTGCVAAVANGTAPLIDDFESVSPRILPNEGRGGWWFVYDDKTPGSVIRERVALDHFNEVGHALHFRAQGFRKWGAGFGFAIHPATTYGRGCVYDASGYSGLSFRIRGNGRVRLTLGDVSHSPLGQGGSCTRAELNCHDRPGVWITLDDAWKRYELPFCRLVSDGWGGSSDALDPSRLLRVIFQTGDLHEDERGNIQLWLDDLAFYRVADGSPAPKCGAPCPLEAAPATARFDPSSSSATLSDELTLHTFPQETKACGTLTRRYLSYVPRRLKANSSAPVLIVLHGRGANAESSRTFLTRNRFEALADRDGFIVIYANAAPSAHSNPNPQVSNTGTWRQSVLVDGQVDDIDYLERVLDDLVERKITRGDNPVLLTGISNGGGMVLEAARRMRHGVQGVAAWMPFEGDSPSPVPDLRASDLKRVIYAYSVGDPGLSEGYYTISARQPAAWAAALGISQEVIAAPNTTPLADSIAEGAEYRGDHPVRLATRDSRATQFDMAESSGDRRLRVLVLDHAGHLWPNPEQFSEDWVLDRFGFRNQDFDASDMVWEYLRGALRSSSPRAVPGP